MKSWDFKILENKCTLWLLQITYYLKSKHLHIVILYIKEICKRVFNKSVYILQISATRCWICIRKSRVQEMIRHLLHLPHLDQVILAISSLLGDLGRSVPPHHTPSNVALKLHDNLPLRYRFPHFITIKVTDQYWKMNTPHYSFQ